MVCNFIKSFLRTVTDFYQFSVGTVDVTGHCYISTIGFNVFIKGEILGFPEGTYKLQQSNAFCANDAMRKDNFLLETASSEFSARKLALVVSTFNTYTRVCGNQIVIAVPTCRFR